MASMVKYQITRDVLSLVEIKSWQMDIYRKENRTRQCVDN